MRDLSKWNDLPTEAKVLIANGYDLLKKAAEAMNNREYDFDLTSKRELRFHIKNVERYMNLIKKGKVTEKNMKKLENAIICLQTMLNGLISFFTR